MSQVNENSNIKIAGTSGQPPEHIEPQQTSQKLLAQALEERDRLLAVVRSIADEVWMCNAQGRIVLVNGSVCEGLGLDIPDLLFQPLDEVLNKLETYTAEGKPRTLEEAPLHRSLRGETLMGEEIVRHNDTDELRHRQFSSAPIRNPRGDIIGAVSVVRDITRRKQLEAERESLLQRERAAREDAEQNAERLGRLQSVTAALSRALTVEDIAQVMVTQGAAAVNAHASGLGLIDEVGRYYRPSRSLHHSPEDLQKLPLMPIPPNSPSAAAINRRAPVFISSPAEFAESYTYLHPERQNGHQAWATLPLVVQGQVVGLFRLDFDSPHPFTEEERGFLVALAEQCAQAIDRANLYHEAQQARVEAEAARHTAEQATQLRDTFISVASHELRTPLTATRAYAELLKKRLGNRPELGDDERRMLDTIQEQSIRLDKMVENLLDITRLETGQLTLAPQPVVLNDLLSHLVTQITPTLRHHMLTLDMPSESLIANVDELRLVQVVQNLIQNAVKYSPHGGPVTVTLSRDNNAAVIAVADRGIGIPKDAQEKLFTRFYRAANAESNHINGLGVGLYVVREIVRLHGGEVSVESVEGAGSTFTIRIPLLNPGMLHV